MINGFYVIDAHCHIYPEKIASKAVAATDKFYGSTAYGEGTVNDLMSSYRELGVDHAVVQSVATTPHQVKSINEFIAKEVEASDGFLTGLGTLHPESDDICGDIEYLMELGLKGVKLHPDIQGFKVDTDNLLKIYECCEKKGLSILMHTGDYRYDNSNPNRVLPILKAYPKLTVIGAHFGGWSIWEEACEKYSDLPNFYVDCSSSFEFSDEVDFKALVLRYGTDRVLFGTDYPMWSAEKELKTFFAMNLHDEANRLILSENAKRIFNI
ncbi:MAG: amidohydrolase [Clostridia bacterium]|nr:amidohydrolase [Clostridia bacterium]